MIRVFNDGNGIPVEIHKDEGVYVPELIFGHLLTSSNYDDNEEGLSAGETVTAPSWPTFSPQNSSSRRAMARAGNDTVKFSTTT